MANETTGAIQRIWNLAWMLFGAVVMAWIAVHLLASIWEPLALIALASVLIVIALRWWRWRNW